MESEKKSGLKHIQENSSTSEKKIIKDLEKLVNNIEEKDKNGNS